MSLTDAYMTVEDFKTRIGRSDAGADAAIAAALLAASRNIDNFCNDQFGNSGAPEVRTFDDDVAAYDCYGGVVLDVGPLVSVAEIASGDGTGAYPTVWDPASYVLWPRDAAAKGRPYLEIHPPATRSYAAWVTTAYGLQITAVWGWPAVPAPIAEVAFLQANRLKSLWTSPFGVTSGSGSDMGGINMTNSLTPLMKEMLAPYRRLVVG